MRNLLIHPRAIPLLMVGLRFIAEKNKVLSLGFFSPIVSDEIRLGCYQGRSDARTRDTGKKGPKRHQRSHEFDSRKACRTRLALDVRLHATDLLRSLCAPTLAPSQ